MSKCSISHCEESENAAIHTAMQPKDRRAALAMASAYLVGICSRLMAASQGRYKLVFVDKPGPIYQS